jgi:hypothetical protein
MLGHVRTHEAGVQRDQGGSAIRRMPELFMIGLGGHRAVVLVIDKRDQWVTCR